MLWSRHYLLLAVAILWCSLILSYPWILASGQSRLAVLLALFFSQICHQNPARTFSIGGISLPICSRCIAIYLSAFVGILAYSWMTQSKNLEVRMKRLAWAATVPLLLDIALDLTTVWTNTFLSRALTGSLFGLVGGIYLALAIQKLPANLSRQCGKSK
jgi:uncharacterized membrane protein